VHEAVTSDPLPIQTVEVACRPQGVTTDSGSHDDSHPLHESLAGLEARMLKDRYRIGSEIGRGGMGVVFAGWDTQLERPVAIKVLAVNSRRPAQTQRFLREARIASRLNHPGIMAVHEFGMSGNGLAFIVMRLLDGQTLKALLTSCQDRSAELPRFLTIFLQACQAVTFAHDQGVIHRDLKPDHIMVGNYGAVTVIDWGLAKILSALDQQAATAARDETPESDPFEAQIPLTAELNTLCGAIVGTSCYLPPEQARGDKELIDRRSDVFALGAILCEILTGLPPFTSGSAASNWTQSAQGCLDSALERLDARGGLHRSSI